MVGIRGSTMMVYILVFPTVKHAIDRAKDSLHLTESARLR